MLAILVVIRKTLIYGAGLALLSFLLWYLYIETSA
jgi:hypothetical protein